MTNKEFWEKNLEFNTNLVEKLEPFSDRKVSELPDDLKAGLQKIKVGPKITTSGLESVYSLLGELYLINASLRQAIKDPVGFMKMYGGKPTTNNPQPTTNNPQPTTIDKETEELKNIETENKIVPKISIKPTQHSTIVEKPETKNSDPSTKAQGINTPPPASKIEL